jgi:lysophospholipase L1-like esterase
MTLILRKNLSREMTYAEMDGNLEYLLGLIEDLQNGSGGGGTTPTGVFNVEGDGNSLMRGALSSNENTQNPVALLQGLLPNNFVGYSNAAVSGQTVPSMIQRLNSFVFSQFNSSAAMNILVMGDGINDIIGSGDSPDTVYHNYKTYFSLAKDRGYKTIVLTTTACMKEYGIGLLKGENARQELDRLVRQGWKTDLGCDAMVDVGADNILGVFNPFVNSTYFNSDGQHFTDAGYARKANLIKPAVLAIAAGTSYGTEQPQLPAPSITLSPGGNSVAGTISAVSGANLYIVMRNTVNSPAGATQVYRGSALTFTDTGLNAQTTYYYFAKAQGSTQRESAYKFMEPVTTSGTVIVEPPPPAATGNLRNYAADAGVTVTANSFTWANQSGATDNMTAVSSTALPAVVPSGLNGRAILQFNKTPVISTELIGITANGPRTFMMVTKLTRSIVLNNANLMGIADKTYTDSDQPNGKFADMISFQGNLQYHVGNLIATGAVFPANVWLIISIVFDGANVTLYLNGTASSSQAISSATMANGKLRIGGASYDNGATGLEDYTAQIAEVIVRNDADQSALATNQAYLKKKWGL